MQSELTTEDIEYFFIRLYFNTSKGLLHAAMQRAYRDFNRTILNIPKETDTRTQWRYKLYQILKERIEIVLRIHYQSEKEFDNWHKETCGLLVEKSESIITIGQAQKWVNMTLKYLFSFGEKRISGISLNYNYFHIPIDNIIQNAFKTLYNIQRIRIAWSKINDYSSYMRYQQQIRIKLFGKVVMDEEFRLFNKYLK